MITIIEFEDFAKWLAMQEWAYIKEQYADGEKDFIDKTTSNHKEFEFSWFMIGTFRRKHGLPHIIYDPDGNEITEAEYYDILSKILEGGDAE